MTEDQKATEQRMAMYAAMKDEFQIQQDGIMGQLYNQIVSFVAASELDLTQVLLVLKMIERDIVDQARAKYLGGS